MEPQGESKYERVKRLARIRQKRWYDKNVRKVSEYKKEQRALFKELKTNAGLTVEPPPPIEPEYVPIVRQPVTEIAKFNTLTDKQIKKIKKVPTKSKQTLSSVLATLKKSTPSTSTYTTYKTTIEQLYNLTGTDIKKPLNLNNPEILFQQLDNLKKANGEEYGIDKKTNIIQTLVKLGDPKNGFNLDVTKSAISMYNKKFDEFKILKTDNQTSKKEKAVPLFSDILKKALNVFGKESKFYLYLKLYQLAPLRDNFQLKIIHDMKDAKKKDTNYIFIPLSKRIPVKNSGRSIVVNKEGTLIFNTYKTEKKYKDLVYQMTPEITKLTRDYITRESLKEGDYLFGNVLMSLYIGQELKKLGIEQTGANVNLLRHAVATEFYVGKENPTAKERMEFATSMGHSADMNNKYIRQISG